MENPIQASTPPPATEKASSETPKTWSTLAPTSAAMTRMSQSCGARLTGLDLREQRAADQGIHQRKNRHNRLEVLLHLFAINPIAGDLWMTIYRTTVNHWRSAGKRLPGPPIRE
jgi:hypothetical protein